MHKISSFIYNNCVSCMNSFEIHKETNCDLSVIDQWFTNSKCVIIQWKVVIHKQQHTIYHWKVVKCDLSIGKLWFIKCDLSMESCDSQTANYNIMEKLWFTKCDLPMASKNFWFSTCAISCIKQVNVEHLGWIYDRILHTLKCLLC